MLPFENLGRRTSEYFADGITDEVRGKLAGAAGPPGHRVEQLEPVQADHQDAAARSARELGVQYLLIGKVRWEKGAGGRAGCG